jgi:hypothetical protein
VKKSLRVSEPWVCRWLVLPRWGALHRVFKIKWDGDDLISGDGMTMCGRRGRLVMPGFMSRLRLKRCGRCCDAACVPKGFGAPYNDKTLSKELQAR